MTSFLIINSDYEQTSVSLWNDTILLGQKGNKNRQASKYLVPDMQELLQKSLLSFSDIDFIGINQGPGPFTTLRVNLATANGIAFASKKPLIGIDSLKAILEEQTNEAYLYTIALFNAYNQDAYYGIQIKDAAIQTGYKKIDILLEELKKMLPSQQIRFIGNGVKTFEASIINILGDQAYIPNPLPLHCSSYFLAQLVLQKWQNKQDIAYQLLPLYLKEMHYKKQIHL